MMPDTTRRELNRFGAADVLTPENLPRPVYIECAACLSVYSEWWEWAEDHADRITRNPAGAASIVVLGCQVTDLAVLNDFRTAERLATIYPSATVYMGGCLARRFDIPMPWGRVVLVDDGRMVPTRLRDRTLVHWQAPFWIEDFAEDGTQLRGNQFRAAYPIRVGRGCKGKCAFCTINATRGQYQEYTLDKAALAENPGAVLVGDSPTTAQVETALQAALELGASLAIRNIEPSVALATQISAVKAAEVGVLWAWHCPIQSTNPGVVVRMRRNAQDMSSVLALSLALRSYGVWTATNVIWDFIPGDRSDDAAKYFDHVAWNPYWDGKWDRVGAERRWAEYLTPEVSHV